MWVGLVGDNSGPVTNSFSSASVTAGQGTYYVGGLAGYSNVSISNAYSSGAVIAIGSYYVGGLVGVVNGGTLSDDYSTGSVTAGGASLYVGGLVGANYVSITDDYSSAVVVAGAGSNDVGGLIGYNAGPVSLSYSSGAVSAAFESLNVGGLVGENDAAISNAYSLGAVSGYDNVAGLVGQNDTSATITNAYSTGLVTGTNANPGGLVGANYGAISHAFWDTTTSETGEGIGYNSGGTPTDVFGLTTPDLLLQSTYAGTNTSSLGNVVTIHTDGSFTNSGVGTNIAFGSGFNIGADPTSNTWVILNGQTRPLLAMEYSTTITNAHQLQLIGLNSTTLAASYTQADNLDLSAVTNASEVWATSVNNGGAGFVPIGNGTQFVGTFNGQGHTIDSLYISLPDTVNVGAVQRNFRRHR